MKGLVISLIAGIYKVKILSEKSDLFNQIIICKPAGKLRYMRLSQSDSFNVRKTFKTKLENNRLVKLSPKVGDIVLVTDEGEYIIQEIFERKNALNRPDCVNIDQVLLVFSLVTPDFSYYLLDKFLTHLKLHDLPSVIVITKIDKAPLTLLEDIKTKMKYYEKLGYKVFYVNSILKDGFYKIDEIFKEKITILAGQTGSGKSSFLNAIRPELTLKTNEISKALGRGKHTTRHLELFEYNKGYICDTPGFSKLDLISFDANNLKLCFPDFVEKSIACKFKGDCLHLNEPNCAVKAALGIDIIYDSRYESYLQFYEEIKNIKKKY